MTVKIFSLLFCLGLTSLASAQPKIDLSQFQKNSGFAVTAKDSDTLRLAWPTEKNLSAEIIFNLRENQPLIQSLG